LKSIIFSNESLAVLSRRCCALQCEGKAFFFTGQGAACEELVVKMNYHDTTAVS